MFLSSNSDDGNLYNFLVFIKVKKSYFYLILPTWHNGTALNTKHLLSTSYYRMNEKRVDEENI